MSAITAKASRKMKKYAVLTREPRCFLGSLAFSWEQRKFSEITFLSGEKNRENLPLESYSITNESGFVPQDEKFENGGTMREANKRMYYLSHHLRNNAKLESFLILSTTLSPFISVSWKSSKISRNPCLRRCSFMEERGNGNHNSIPRYSQ